MTTKPVLYVCNVDEDHAGNGQRLLRQSRGACGGGRWGHGGGFPPLLRRKSVSFAAEERGEFLEGLGLKKFGSGPCHCCRISTPRITDLFHCRSKETRAWTIVAGTKAPQAAAVIHNDFERGFIAW